MSFRLRQIGAACLTLFLAACGAAPGSNPYRCLEDVNLAQLIKAEGLPQEQTDPWGTSAVATASENRVFDGEQEAILVLDDPGPFVGRLCDRLKAQLAERCVVEDFWPGAEHCVASLRSPQKAVTSAVGVYTSRPVSSRVALFASKMPEGKTALILTTMEWAH